MSAWGARQLQIVWFAQTRFEAKALEIFSLLGKDEPTATQTGQLPTPTGMSPFEMAQGLSSNYAYHVQKQSNRIDLFIQPNADINQEDVADKLENVVEIKQVLLNWSDLITKHTVGVSRVGIVANLINDQNSQESANKDIINRIGLSDTIFGKSTDVNLQANFPSQRDWGRLNRITRWQVEAFRNVQMILQGSLPVQTMGSPHYCSALMLDYNSVANSPILKENNISEIIIEAIEGICEIWETGNLSGLQG